MHRARLVTGEDVAVKVQRPGAQLAPGLWACGDYIAGPYPATLEGAVLSGTLAGRSVGLGNPPAR